MACSTGKLADTGYDRKPSLAHPSATALTEWVDPPTESGITSRCHLGGVADARGDYRRFRKFSIGGQQPQCRAGSGIE
jgi:hypothetical protein